MTSSSGTEPAPRHPTLHALTGLRFFAALHVVLYHSGDALLPPPWLRTLMHAGYSAVSLFFVLSGFILTYNYAEPLASGRVKAAQFWWARLARIYPLYAILVLVEIPLQLKHMKRPLAEVVTATGAHLFAVQAFVPRLLWVGNVPGWSISVELFFYLAFPWLLSAVSATATRRRLLIIMMLWWLAGLTVAGAAHALSPSAPWMDWVRFSPITRLPEFMIGIGLGRLFLAERRERRSPTIGTRLALFALVSLAPIGWMLEPRIPYLLSHNGLLAPAYASFIYALAHGRFGAGAIGSVPLVRAGEVSYAIYILQHPLFLALNWIGVPFGSRAVMAPWTLVFMELLIAAAFVAHYAVERPARRLIRHWSASGVVSARYRLVPFAGTAAVVSMTLAEARLPRPPSAAAAQPASSLPGAPRGVRYGARVVPGAADSGFWPEDGTDAPFRWTNGNAWLELPLNGRNPRAVWVSIGTNPIHDCALRISTDTRLLYENVIPPQGLVRELALGEIPRGSALRLHIRSCTFVPSRHFSSSRDDRLLGVPVEAVILMD